MTAQTFFERGRSRRTCYHKHHIVSLGLSSSLHVCMSRTLFHCFLFLRQRKGRKDYTYPTPGIMSSTSAVDVSIHAISPAYISSTSQHNRTVEANRPTSRTPRSVEQVRCQTYIIIDIQIIRQTIPPGRNRSIIRDLLGVIERTEINPIDRGS